MSLVAKDNNTGKKHVCEIEDPEYIWFVAKEPDKLTHHYDFLPKNELEAIQCPNRELEKCIAQTTAEIFYKYNGEYRENAKLHTLNQVFFSDQNIEDH